jgi:hypothetical protein
MGFDMAYLSRRRTTPMLHLIADSERCNDQQQLHNAQTFEYIQIFNSISSVQMKTTAF